MMRPEFMIASILVFGLTAMHAEAGNGGDCPIERMTSNIESITSFRDFTEHPIDLDSGNTLSGAPLAAVGKLIASSNPRDPALCTAVYEGSAGVVLTDKFCFRTKKAFYFVPASSERDPAPYGVAHITRYWWDNDHDFAIGKVEFKHEPPSMAWQAIPGRFPSTWTDDPYWAMTGYRRSGSLSPALVTGCSLSGSTDSNSNLLRYECFESADFSYGTPVFANLCGRWTFVAIYTGSESVLRFNEVISTLHYVYNKLGVKTVTPESCEHPGFRIPKDEGYYEPFRDPCPGTFPWSDDRPPIRDWKYVD